MRGIESAKESSPSFIHSRAGNSAENFIHIQTPSSSSHLMENCLFFESLGKVFQQPTNQRRLATVRDNHSAPRFRRLPVLDPASANLVSWSGKIIAKFAINAHPGLSSAVGGLMLGSVGGDAVVENKIKLFAVLIVINKGGRS